jgi:hypothetical protein
MAEKKMRVVKRSKKNNAETAATEPVVPYVEPPVAPDAVPISFPSNEKEKIDQNIPIVYTMRCRAGEYQSSSWIGLGWSILKHRLWHVYNDGKFMD